MNITWQLKLVSSANKNESPFALSARKKKHRDGILMRLANPLRLRPMKPPYRVRLVRIGPRMLDEHDNLRHAFKHIVDGVCKALGVKDDSDTSKITFTYAQERGEYAVRVEIEEEER